MELCMELKKMNCDDIECGLNCNGSCLSLAWANYCDCPDYLEWEKDNE
jgi:hypothetical protein